MAEFCFEFFKKIGNMNLTVEDVVLSKGVYFCEECCCFKPIVETFMERPAEFYYLPPRRRDGCNFRSPHHGGT